MFTKLEKDYKQITLNDFNTKSFITKLSQIWII
jgi:hypothetical protein